MSLRAVRGSMSAALAVGVLALVACGKSTDSETRTGGDTAARGAASTTNVENAPMRSVLEAAGYQPVFYRRFPAQVPGMKASVVVYRARSGKDGGVLYLQQYGERDRVVWHWYFESDAPDSVASFEVNGDGLWDVRMYVRGEARDYLQDQSFTFVRSQRDDRVAMNGPSSEPVDADAMSWLCFDGDTTTAWRSRVGSGGAFIVLPVPLGIDEGILSVQLRDAHQPLRCEVQAGGKTVQSFDLQATEQEQLIQLDAEARSARSLRLVVVTGAAEVAISELGLK